MSLKKIHNNKYYSETLSNMVSVSRKKYKLNLFREAENYAKIAMLISPANLDALYVAALFIKTNDNIIRRVITYQMNIIYFQYLVIFTKSREI